MRLVILCLPLLALIAGCAAVANSPSATAAASTQPHAECLVCKANADLACVDVTVSQSTPSYFFNGRTYYFCSEDCRDRFAKNPNRYLEK